MSGIGNVYLTLENCEMADSIFRIALEEERTLDSDLGLAMNYANLGSIFEMRGMMDSAFVYYNYSMEHNRAAGSVVGISLCHNHIGRLFEKRDNGIRRYANIVTHTTLWWRTTICIIGWNRAWPWHG